MPGRIVCPPDRIRSVSAQFQDAGQQSQELVNRLQNAANGLEPEWEGMAQERFYQEFQRWQSSMRQFVELLGGISRELDEVARLIEEADRQAASMRA